MSDHAAEDFVQYLVDHVGLFRMKNVFTDADQGAYDDRSLAVLVREVRNPDRPEVTEDVDYLSIMVTVSGTYGQKGEKNVAKTSMDVYRALKLLLDVEINDTLYLSVTAATPPVFSGFDQYSRIVYETTFDIIRYLGSTKGEEEDGS